MWPWLPTAIAGAGHLLGFAGQHSSNKTNIQLAREQMAFQERMSHSAEAFSERMASTQAQRSVADYKAAGLNPALAYERGAAAPAGVTAGGAQARVENVMRDAPNIAATALAAKQMAAQLKVTDAQEALLREQARNTLEDTQKKTEEKHLLDQQFTFNAAQQPSDLRQRIAAASLSELALPAGANKADFEKMLAEKMRGGGATAKAIAIAIQTLRSLLKEN